ncbi:carbohydrate sulfotransferase 4-like isoform X1 [Microplitis mediator]|uniref:carbohydrate sulfotransferase 4-like isoform X1 n=1 Tax=Microplitis mediator TaxID=375433 RepID=UPI00255661A8|nr:carbohydrate sulfotransferase 4-like isoform X1 [Microplitis mediator]
MKKFTSSGMPRRTGFVLLVLMFFCFFLLFFYHRNRITEYQPQPIISEDSLSLKIQNILDQLRRNIKHEMENYEFPNGKFSRNISNLDDLLMEKGGRPMRSILVADWRTGSSFTGNIINSHPANFYLYEPLRDFGSFHIRDPLLVDAAIKNIYKFFNCEFDKLQYFIDFNKHRRWIYKHNQDLEPHCVKQRDLCSDPIFLTAVCRLYPFQSMKFVRLSLESAQLLLEDEHLGARMILLVRDPRGIMQSRRRLEWCQNSTDCSDPQVLCNDMVSDHKVAIELKKKYLHTFKVVRFEDLSLDPQHKAKEIFEFYGLNFHSNVEEFLETHTKNNSGNSYSSFRDSKRAPVHWRNEMNFTEVEEIQRVCSTAMKLWGYVLAVNETHQKEFNPIVDNYRPF